MKFRRRWFLHLVAGAVALPAISHIAKAQAYPTRPACIVVPLAAGGNNDILARRIVNGCPNDLANRSLSKIGPVPPALSASRRS
jgi:tripartite-type tricarboxylate transporter receptor subunit TctC